MKEQDRLHEIAREHITQEVWNYAPAAEPERQLYFIKELRKITDQYKQETGLSPVACVRTFGCQMNSRDSEKFRGILKTVGYENVEREDADLVLYNTCTVRENANLKVYGHLGALGAQKKKNPHMHIALCGCMMQEPQVVERIRKSYPFVNLIFGTHNVFKLAELLWLSMDSDRTLIDIWKDTDQIVEDLPCQRKYSFKSGVNIMFGCNNFCSYCIVPYVRGRERSRSPKDILREVRALAKEGVVEVMLLGQNVNSYGKTLEEPMSFAELLEETAQVEGIERIRFMTSHPKDLSDELISVMSRYDKICPHMHLPLQSGSSRLLKIMNRKYTKERYLELVDKLRAAIPDISLTTDIIVGFPGETEEDFQETLDVVRRVRYDSAFTFLYSKRTGTPAAAMENQVPEETAKERFNRLLEEVQETAKEMSSRFAGQTLPVLVEEVNSHTPGLMTGRLANNLLVHFPGGPELLGQIRNVRLDESRGFYYMGTLADSPGKDG